MTDSNDLLIEIGTEELPPKALKGLSDAFAQGILRGLDQAGLKYTGHHAYATPRRLALLVNQLDSCQPDKKVEKRGPAVAAAFDDEGCPTQAAQGFARSCGMDVNDLETMETSKGSWLVYRSEQKGQHTPSLLPDILQQAADALPVPKRMRWSDLSESFVRPVHWLVVLFGNEVVPVSLLSQTAGRETRGHRFHHPQPLFLAKPAAYAPLLESEGQVMADYDTRREAVRAQVVELAHQHGGTAVIDESLLDEVTSLVEWPTAILGAFDQRFLEVPAEALISAMKDHQKYFHLVDKKGKLMPCFITVSNIQSTHADVVRDGNERVINPRLTDANFFWTQDCKIPLADYSARLASVVFQKKLGSLLDKSERIQNLAGSIATELGFDQDSALRAASLCKCDLMTDMVGEFPGLQGIMGRYYATASNETAEVAQAIEDHYRPRFAGDELPATTTGQAVAIADKLDTLVGIFGIGQAPTGDKDPFALRRAALGIVRILIEQDLGLDLRKTIHTAITVNEKNALADDTASQVYEFFLARTRVYYSGKGYAADEIDAILSLSPAVFNDMNHRLRALSVFRSLPEADSLAAANKRISNLLNKADAADIPAKVSADALLEPAEKSLANALTQLQMQVEQLLSKGDFTEAMKQLAGLREPVDNFFDDVMVMVDDLPLRNNRLALLSGVRKLFLSIADLSRLQAG
ncbi:MAG TPA: glycine--tRNA ligase subunit beta [Gammaproteobacteria bacterium]|nr:glycine--tRNA ligase subunit beta [Gammaproteobacteria bacterium]